MNDEGGIRTLLAVCTTDPARIQSITTALGPTVQARSFDWKSYSVAQMIFRTEKRGGVTQQEWRDGSAPPTLVVCATRPESVRTVEKLCDLPE